MKNWKKILIILVALAFALGFLFLFIIRERVGAPSPTQPTIPLRETDRPDESAPEETSFDKTLHSIDEPGSIWQIVNKERPLPADYTPDDLIVPNVRLRLNSSEEQMRFRRVAAEDLTAMFAAAKKDGVTLVFGSGYRSYALQKQFYDGYVTRDGQAAADRYSARPGTSEHQTGLSFDVTTRSGVCHLEICFAYLAEGEWVAAHAYEHGFIVRYPDGQEAVTGYQYEPWHLRYIGKELAREVKDSGLTLEEFFEL